MALGALADTPRFRRSLKILIFIPLIGCFVSVLWFQLSVSSVFSDKAILSSSKATIGISLALAGLFQGAVSPLLYESSAEIMFPLPESLSASILVQWNNVACVSLLFVAADRYQMISLIVLIIVAVAIVMVAFARVTYRRRDEEERQKNDLTRGIELGANYSFTNPLYT